MKHIRLRLWLAFGLITAGAVDFTTPAVEAQTTNSWQPGFSSKWETPFNWSLGVAPTNTHALILITNAATKTVIIDATTTNKPTMTISNLTLSAPSGATNTLFLDNAGTATPLRILNAFTITSGGSVLLTNSALRVGSVLIDGSVTMESGSVISNLTSTVIGGSASGSLTVRGGTITVTASRLTLGASSGSTGTIWMTGSSGTLVQTNNVSQIIIGSNGVGQVTVSNGIVSTRSVTVGDQAGSQGTLTIAGGQLVATPSTTKIGSFGVGRMTVFSGTVLLSNVTVALAGSSQGTLTFAGGTNEVGLLIVANDANATGTVWVMGGQLMVNDDMRLGQFGVGQMTISNSTVFLAGDVSVANGTGSQGTLTIAGGDCLMAGNLTLASGFGSTGTVWVTGGQLTNGFMGIGAVSSNALGQMTVSNGTVSTKTVLVAGNNAGGRGILTIAGGTNNVYTSMALGIACTATGTVVVAGGSLFVTNANGNATLEVRSGTFTLSSGTVIVDKFVMTQACGHFVRTGGTLIYSNAVLTSTRDDDGDGISNGYEQSHGLDPLNAADANVDNDGDGFTNLQEFLAGTDATNSASAFRITSIGAEGINIRVTWMMGSGKTNALQRTAGASGSYATNNFTTIFTVTNTVGTVTNYLDTGAATNTPALYYRIRLVP